MTLHQYSNSLEERIRNETISRWMKWQFPDVAHKAVLDVGAGPGYWTSYWLKRGANVTAIDSDTLRLVVNESANPLCRFMCGDASKVQYNQKFDLIFAKDVIEHIPSDTVFLANMYNHLNPRGSLVLFTQNSLSANYFIEGAFHFLTGDLIWKGYDDTHLRFYNAMRLTAKLKNAGFEPLAWSGAYHFPYRFLSEFIAHRMVESKAFHVVEVSELNTVWPFSVTGWNIGVIARKI